MWPGTSSVPVREGVTRAIFEAEIVPAARPVLLKGLVADWPLVAAARASDEVLGARLTDIPARGPVGVWIGAAERFGRFGYSDDVRGYDHERRQMPLADLVATLLANRANPEAPRFYAGGVPIDRVLPSLLPELPMPLLDPTRERLTSLWIGGRTRTAAHWDVPQNLACVVAGRRRFTLFRTDQVANLYVGPLDFTPAGQPISLVDFAAPDLDRFPRFAEAIAAAEVAELEPGDALYLPSLWWHHVETPDPFGAMVNFWWRDAPEHAMTPLFTLLHALLTLRDLPDAERRAWRTMFDHYVFEDDDPAAHLPRDARGVLGEMTPDTVRRLREIVAAPLTRK